MQTLTCPSCGAPPAPGFVIPAGRFNYSCPYCRQQSVHGEDPQPQPQAQVPAIIIVQGPGSDFESDYNQAAVANAVVRSSISWIVWVIIVVVVSVGGAGAAFWRTLGKSTMLSSLVWNGTEPLQCGGNDDISVSGVTATFNAGTAIIAGGNCHVKCTDCKITAPTAIEASGNAQVTCINGFVHGTDMLADASGNARVTISGNVDVTGRVHERANAKVSAPQPTAAAAPATTPAAAAAAAPKPTPTAKPATPTPTKPKH